MEELSAVRATKAHKPGHADYCTNERDGKWPEGVRPGGWYTFLRHCHSDKDAKARESEHRPSTIADPNGMNSLRATLHA